jgi:hypothetical protein
VPASTLQCGRCGAQAPDIAAGQSESALQYEPIGFAACCFAPACFQRAFDRREMLTGSRYKRELKLISLANFELQDARAVATADELRREATGTCPARYR